MKGFILAAGFGKRLRPLTADRPKPLIPLLNVPAICYSLFLLKEAGIRDIVINLHYRARDVIHFFCAHSNFGLQIHFSVEDKILGTGGGLKNCEVFLAGEQVLLINSDIITDVHLADLIKAHENRGIDATLLLARGDVAKSGDVGIENGLVRDFNNLLGSGFRSDRVYAGAAVLEQPIFQTLIPEYSSIVNTGFFPLVLQKRMGYMMLDGFWRDIGSLADFWRTSTSDQADILSLGRRMHKSIGLEPVAVHSEADVADGCHIENSVIGRDVTVRAKSLIRSVFIGGGVADLQSYRNVIIERGLIQFTGNED